MTFEHQDANEVNTRLGDAFKDLRAQGYFARKHWQCCQSCGWAAVPEEKSDKAVFFHRQDSDRLRAAGKINLAWAGDAQTIRSALERAGLYVEHDGSTDQRFEVSLPIAKTADQIVGEQMQAFIGRLA